MPTGRLKSLTVAQAVVAAVWICAIALPPAALLGMRSAWLAEFETPEAQARWDEFREAMREETGTRGPVQRKVPKSVEPPLRVWLRDYVWLAIAAWLVLGGTLGSFTALLALGAVTAGVSPAEDQPRRDRDHEEQHERDAEDAEQG